MNMFKCIVIAGISLFIIGCAGYDLERLARKSINYEIELNILNSGLNTFEQGDFQKASEIFQNLTNDTEDDNIRRKALYGLACARLILANSQEQFSDAVVLWENWSKLRGAKLGNEDPRMCSPLFQKIAPSFIELSCPKIEHTEPVSESDEIEDEPEESDSLPKSDNNSQKPPSCYRMLKIREKEIRNLKTVNAKMKKDIQMLKDQLNSLEAIHRKIQEKKKEISVP